MKFWWLSFAKEEVAVVKKVQTYNKNKGYLNPLCFPLIDRVFAMQNHGQERGCIKTISFQQVTHVRRVKNWSFFKQRQALKQGAMKID